MYFRRDLIPTPPSSWEELLRTGRDLLSEDGNLTPYLFPAGRDEATVTTSLFPYFWAQGGELVDGEGNPVFGEGENREAMLDSLSFIQECVESGITPDRVTEFGQETDLNGDVASGQTAMFLGGNWQVGLLKEIIGAEEFVSQWDVAPIPSMEGGDNHSTTAGGWIWGVFTEDEAKQEAGVDFLKYAFVDDAGMAGWCNVGGYLPPRESVFDLSDYQGNEYTDTFRDHLNRYARNRPAAESYQDISTALQVAVGQVVSGEASPEQALDTAVSSV
jgi:multiple sugar transport system substrate-binding protein